MKTLLQIRRLSETRVSPDRGALRLRNCGDSALCVEFGDRVDGALSAQVLALDVALGKLAIPGVIETVPTYRSLLIHVDPFRVDFGALESVLRRLGSSSKRSVVPSRRWSVPVVYGGEFGVDLKRLAAERGMTPQEFVAIHSAAIYTVYMIGFMPGFTYLGGLDSRLAAPRRPEPRPRVPAGSIAIGGSQASIGSVESPSGWHLIGRTPVRCFLPERQPAFLFEAGHEVVFEPVPAESWEQLAASASAGAPVASVTSP